MANDIPASVILIMKKRMVYLALLFCGQSLFAGGDGSRHRGRTGELRSTIASAAGLAAKVFSGSDEADDDDFDEDIESLGEVSSWFYAVMADDDDNDSDAKYEERETKNEQSEEDVQLQGLPPEVLKIIYTGLKDDELTNIAAAFQEMASLINETLRKRGYEREAEEVTQLASSSKVQDQSKAVESIKKLLLYQRVAYSPLRLKLLAILAGENQSGGLIRAEELLIRLEANTLIQDLVEFGGLNNSELRLLIESLLENWENEKIWSVRIWADENMPKTTQHLIGEDALEEEIERLVKESGLIDSLFGSGKERAVRKISQLLSSSGLSDSQRLRLFKELLTLAGSWNHLERKYLARAMGVILASYVPSDKERKVCIATLDGLIKDSSSKVRKKAAKALEQLQVMSPAASVRIDAMILQLFALFGDDEIAELSMHSCQSMQMRVRYELKRREAIYWLSQPGLSQQPKTDIMKQMLWAIEIALTEFSITSEYYEYLLETLISRDGKSGLIEHEKAYVRGSIAITLWRIIESWKTFPERATSARIDKVMIALIGEHDNGGLIRDSGDALLLRKFATKAIAELLSNRDLLMSGRLSKENRLLLIESLIDEKIRNKMQPDQSLFNVNETIRAIGKVLKSRVFYFEEEALLLFALFGSDGNGGFSSAKTHSYLLEHVAWVIEDIFPYYSKGQRERFLNALIGKEGMGGILRHIETSKSDPFAQWGAMSVIVELLQSDAPDLQERKRLMDALKSINCESAFLNEDCMEHVRSRIL